MMRSLHSAFVIARRDFGATVLSKAFIFFLLGPLFPLLLGGVFGSIGARVATRTERPVIAVIAPHPEFQRLMSARNAMAAGLDEASVVKLVGYEPEADVAAQEKRLLALRDPPVRAVLSGGFEHPHLTGALADDQASAAQLQLLMTAARAPKNGSAASSALQVTNVSSSPGSIVRDREVTAQIGQIFLFFLTLFLAGMVLSQLIEEKSNKVIEVIAAAVPIDAMFVGKLFAMLAASVIGIVVWVSCGALFVELMRNGGVQTLPPPAVGWTAFLLLSIVYFAMNYLLIGSIFLMIGAQASTAREVQTLSMPATFGQFLIFGLASTAIGAPDSAEGIAAMIFPLSSPMAMLARAAERPDFWPHLAAILWQGLWVVVILQLGAQLFRKTVLKSGPRRPWWKFSRA